MAPLRAMFEEAGCSRVSSYIQSGNIVFEAEDELAERVPAAIAAAISRRYGYAISVVTRRADELGSVVAGNPFLRAGADPATLHVGFLADFPEPGNVAALDGDRSPPDRFAVLGREIFLHCPDGLAGTKLSNRYFEAALKTRNTVRNWRTVLALVELARRA